MTISARTTFDVNTNLYYRLTCKCFADLFVRLNYDGVRLDEFIRGAVEGYLNQDPDFMKYFFSFKEKLDAELKAGERKISRRVLKPRHREVAKKEYYDGVEIDSFFDLSDQEKERIFDEFESE